MANNQTFTLNIKAVADMKDVQSNIQNIQNALSKLKLPDNLKTSFKQTFSSLDRELENYQRLMQSGFKNKGDANALEKSGNNIIRLYDEVVKKINSIDDSTLKKAFEDLGAKEVEKLRQELNGLENDLKSKLGNQKFIDFSAAKASLKDFTSQFKDAEGKINSTFKTLSNSTINTFFKNIDIGRLDLAANNLDKIEQQVKELNNTDLNTWFNQLKTGFIQLTSDAGIQGTTHAVEELKQKLATVEANTLQNLINGFKEGKISAEQFQQELTKTVTAEHELAQAQAQTNKEIDQVKSRIQYFFGLNNAINLVKRAIRGAVDTVKELDAAMTETAVVTDHTVSDMWAKLPEYTKRANDLGVSTLAAYKSATLYYQQGLNDEQAAALSVETLKMARIAGLEAAEATDRMTNALRGFNMELNEVSAQKVDDVYSQLAAMSASNVDEISTAMTKVASLAHNANMEFETTAAFLAQIIETTRESAETAGTALKTVVARFSEVKKLYDMDELKGKDEEGQTIDVNRVASALRTAGIDLNKYFLGEVGLDDIFMELASKWDSLTSVQQRYIATQAAGSRQQSRFIALMQDYARTQQLVSAAYNANGASARQFEKTQESLQSKLARLKNAWDAFLMGLANNAVIKGAVDLLTLLLNTVNNLTSAFGDGVGGILKWVAAIGAIGGLRSAFSDNGIATKAIGALIKGTPIGNLLGKAREATTLQGSLTTNGQGPRQATIIGNVGDIGKGLWGSAQHLGRIAGYNTTLGGKMAGGFMSMGATEGLAAGLTGVVTALGAVAAAVGVVVAAYTAWLELTPEGQLKQANQIADAMSKVASNTQKTASSYKNVQKSYQEYSDAVKSSSSVSEYQSAIQNRNDYIAQLLESDPAYAEYISSIIDENDQFILTLDESALAAAVDKISDSAVKTAIASQMAQANVNAQQAQVYEAKIARTQALLNDPEAAGLNTKQLELDLIQYQNQLASLNQSAQNQISASARQMLAGSNLDSELANKLADAYASVYDSDEYQKAFDTYNLNAFSRIFNQGARKQEYESIFGVGSAKGMDRKEIADALAGYRIENEQQTRLDAVSELVKSGGYDQILDAIAGNIDFDDFDGAADKIQKFAAAMGKSTDEVEQQIKQSQAARKEIKKTNQASIFEQALKSGRNINQTFSDTIKGLDFEQLKSVSEIINQAAGKVSEETFQSLFDSLPEMSNEALQEIQSFFNNFSLDNPITALEQLNNKIEEVGANSPFGKLLTDIKETNAALFESSNLVQSFLLSESYEQLSDSIEEVTKSNKKLNGKNIKEMAESCKELDTLLQEINEDLGENTDSAQALAEAINLIGEGSLAIDQITDSLLAALGAGESFESLIGNVQQWIEDFDKGTDLTEGTQHITSVLEEAGKYVESWQFGNEPLQNIYDHIFGEGKYAKYMDKAYEQGLPFDQIEAKLAGDIQHLSSLAENEGLGALQELNGKLTGLSSINGSDTEFRWDLSQYKDQENPIQAAIQDVATQLGVTEDTARAFIESWASHMYDLRQEWNDLNFTDAMQAFSQELENQSVITEAELDALTAKTGKTKEEILSALAEIRGQGNVPIVVSWQDEKGGNLTGQDLIDKFNQATGATAREDRIGRANPLMDYSNLLDGINDVNRTVKTELGDTLNTLDFDTLHNHLVEAFKLTPAQATEVADHIAEQTGKSLTKEIKVPIRADDGSITTETKYITASTSEGLQAGIDAAMQAANYALVAEQLASQDVSTVGDNLGKSIEQGGTAGVAAVQQAINSLDTDVQVTVTYTEIGRPDKLATGAIIEYESDASGGVVKSYAKGSENFHVSPGTALTGEEGPELVWNKDGGYAYVTGQDGPEFANLKPGDRIFNASETKRIFKNSNANGGIIDSFASGGWKDPGAGSKKSGSGGSSGGKGGADDKTPEEWKNDLDWLYNLMEDIAELERDQKAIEEQYEDALQDQSKTGRDLYNLLVKQLGNLYTQLDHQTFALQKREQEMREFMDITNDKDQYLWYNWQDRTLEIDWDAIDRITDEEEYKHVKELVDEAEEIQDKMDDADDAIMDITNQIQELENIWRDTFTDFEKRVLDAVVKMYQTVIDNYSELNDTLNNSNQSILDSLQKEINLQRQIRDNTKTEEEISDDEARLAYLRRDTSGGNELAALQLQKELADKRESYEDSLVDQAISRLQDDNAAAQEQRERQIEIMQAQLDYQSENGEFNAYISELLSSAMGADGELLTNSDLVDLLKEQENWSAMSDVNKEVWDEELNGTFKEVAAFLLKQNAEENGTFYTALTAAVENVSSAIGSYSQAMVKIGNQISSAASGGYGGGSSGGSGNSGSSGGSSNKTYKPAQTYSVGGNTYHSRAVQIGTGSVTLNLKKHAQGGLNTTTGLAWLDGTLSEPEYVLNARQTDAFLKLADVLPSMMGPGGNAMTTSFGSNYFNVSVNVDQISSDYDVDRMVDRIKDKLYDDASYRNVNTLSFLR